MLSSAGWLLRVVALTLCGEPTGEADGLKLKFGDVEIDLETGKFYDYDAEHGGYAIDLVRHVRKLENGAAEAWIAEQYLTNELFEPPPLPEQYQAERSILGLALLDREIFASIEEEIVATDFAVDLHAALFDYLAELYRGGGTFDAAAATLAIGGDHEPFAGYSLKAYLARIAAAAPFGIDARVLARSIAEEAARNR